MPILNIGSQENQDIILSNLDESKSDMLSSKTIISGVDNLTTNITNNIPSISDTIPNIESNVASTKDNVASIISNIDYIDQKIDQIDSNLNESSGHMDNTRVNIDSINTEIIDDLTNKVTDSDTKLNSTSIDTVNIQNNIDSVIGKMATLEKENQIYQLVLKMKTAKRYGIKIRKNESDPYNRIEYTYDAEGMKPANMNFNTGIFDYGDWKDVWFIKDNYPCMLNFNGNIDYMLDPDDYNKKIDGSNSDITDYEYRGNVMSRFPLVWVSHTQDHSYEYITVSNKQYDDTYKPLGFVNNSGVLQNEMFLSVYEGIYMYDFMLGKPLMRSLSGYELEGKGKTADIVFEIAKNNGPGWSLQTWAQISLVKALLNIIGKSDNSKNVFGYGNGSSDILPTGSYSLNISNQFYGYNGNSNPMKVFHIENFYGNTYKLLLGLIYNNGYFYYKMNGPFDLIADTTGFTNSNVAWNYKQDEGGDQYVMSGFAKYSESGEWGRLPRSTTGEFGTSTTYLCGYCQGFSDSEDDINLIVYGGGPRSLSYNSMNTLYGIKKSNTIEENILYSRLSYIKS